MKLISLSKKLGVFLSVLIWIITLVISFFCGMAYHWASTVEFITTKDNNQVVLEENDATDYKMLVEIPISEVEAIAKEKKDGIISQDAEELCRKILGEKAEENGFPISYRCISAVDANDKLYYVMHIAWLVDDNHWSYIGNCYVSSDGQEIYDGFASSGKYEMTELRWKQ